MLGFDHHTGTNDPDVLMPLKERYSAQHKSLRQFYYECSNLKFLTSLINVPKLAEVCVYVPLRDFFLTLLPGSPKPVGLR